MTDSRTELSLPSLKNTEYTRFWACSVAALLKQMIHGATEMLLAAIGPATSNGLASFSWSAAFLRSSADVEINGAGSGFSGMSSKNDEQPPRTRHGSNFNNRISRIPPLCRHPRPNKGIQPARVNFPDFKMRQRRNLRACDGCRI
jgi:hypothetical protein